MQTSGTVDSRSPAMRDFDVEFKDIVDYILSITYRIWESKQPELCLYYYSHDCPVYTLTGITQGAQEVTDATRETMRSFPDRTLNGDNVIWSGDAQQGFHTSHLITTRMTDLGGSEYGPATGKLVQFQVIAHCIVKANRIIEEWLVRDNYSLVQQLGYEPSVIAKQQAMTQPDQRYQRWHEAELARLRNLPEDSAGPGSGTNELQSHLLGQLHQLWHAEKPQNVESCYTSKAILHASAHDSIHGPTAIVEFYRQWHATFSDLVISFDHCCSNSRLPGEFLSVRWTLTGTHSGDDVYGPATHAPILVIGESQYRIRDGRVVEEWTVFDQLAIMTQIERARLQVESDQ